MESSITKRQQVGRAILIAALAPTVFLNFFPPIFRVISIGFVAKDAIYFPLFFGAWFGVLYCLWLGMRWAKWITIFHSALIGGLGTTALLITSTQQLKQGPISFFYALVVGILFLAPAIALSFIPTVKEFLAYQRKQRATNQAE